MKRYSNSSAEAGSAISGLSDVDANGVDLLIETASPSAVNWTASPIH
jgi:hypothetical protein